MKKLAVIADLDGLPLVIGVLAQCSMRKGCGDTKLLYLLAAGPVGLFTQKILLAKKGAKRRKIIIAVDYVDYRLQHAGKRIPTKLKLYLEHFEKCRNAFESEMTKRRRLMLSLMQWVADAKMTR